MKTITIEHFDGETTTLTMPELGWSKLEEGDIVKTYDEDPEKITGVYAVVRGKRDYLRANPRVWSICEACCFAHDDGCIQVAIEEYQDPECAAAIGCVFRPIDKILEEL